MFQVQEPPPQTTTQEKKLKQKDRWKGKKADKSIKTDPAPVHERYPLNPDYLNQIVVLGKFRIKLHYYFKVVISIELILIDSITNDNPIN